MANKSIFVDNISILLRNMAPIDLIGSMKIMFDEYEKNEIAPFQETFIDKYFTFNAPQMSLTAEALMGRYHFRVMASVLGQQSKTPLRANKGFDLWTKEIPRLGHKFPMKAEDLRKLAAIIENPRISDERKRKALEDSFIGQVRDSYLGGKDTLDYIVLYSMFNGGVVNFVPAINNPQGIEFQIDYQMPGDNIMVSPKIWNKTNSDAGNLDIYMQLQDICRTMADKGKGCSEILVDPTIYSFMTRELGVRKATYGSDRSSAMVRDDDFQNTLAGYGIAPVHTIRKRVGIEVDSKITTLNPINANNIVFLPETEDGKLGEVQPAVEDSQLIPDNNVSELEVNDGFTISKWSVGDSSEQQPTEYTQCAGRMLPIITEIKGIYSLQVRGFEEN